MSKLGDFCLKRKIQPRPCPRCGEPYCPPTSLYKACEKCRKLIDKERRNNISKKRYAEKKAAAVPKPQPPRLPGDVARPKTGGFR